MKVSAPKIFWAWAKNFVTTNPPPLFRNTRKQGGGLLLGLGLITPDVTKLEFDHQKMFQLLQNIRENIETID